MPPIRVTSSTSLTARAATALLKNRLLALDANDGFIHCTAILKPIGVSIDDADADALIGCDTPASGIQELTASKAIALNASVYVTAAGKVTDTQAGSAIAYGIAIQAAGADGDIIPVLPAPQYV